MEKMFTIILISLLILTYILLARLCYVMPVRGLFLVKQLLTYIKTSLFYVFLLALGFFIGIYYILRRIDLESGTEKMWHLLPSSYNKVIWGSRFTSAMVILIIVGLYALVLICNFLIKTPEKTSGK